MPRSIGNSLRRIAVARHDTHLMIDEILKHLEALVAFDTRNPPRAIDGEGVFAYLRAQLPGFTHELRDHGAGAVSLLATRGRPTRVFNVHMDTVPVAEGWSQDPFRLAVRDGRAIGLGACDIKGAAAALLVAAGRTRGDAAFLYSSDEEANDARCIAAFVKEHPEYTEAVVAEPTRGAAVLSHRGIVSAQARFRGIPGHASARRALGDSAVHRAVEWGAKALAQVRALQDQGFGVLEGLPFNLGRVEGGIKGNVIAGSCEVRFGFRPLPSQSPDALLAMFRGMAAPAHLESFAELFRGPALPAGQGAAAATQLAAGRDLATRLGLPVAEAVDFWTEASLCSQAGLAAIVFGPGDIAQAHAADEWVELAQLEAVARHYVRIIDHGS